MFCEKCGKKNPDGAKFCTGCGCDLNNSTPVVPTPVAKPQADWIPEQPQVQPTEQGKQGLQVQQAPQQKQGPTLVDKLKALPKVVWIGGVLAIIALIAGIFIYKKISSTVDLNKYVVIDAAGYDGYGDARIYVDWDAIDAKYGDKLKLTDKGKRELRAYGRGASVIDLLQDYVEIEHEYDGGLSNGDKVSYTWNVDEEVYDYIEVTLKFKEGSCTVEGLEKIGKFDPFADVEVYFDGISPEGYVDWSYDGEELSYYEFSCDKTYGLSNGDTITLSIDEDNLEYYAEVHGKIPEPLSKTYTVEGLSSYITSAKQVDENTLSEMKQEAVDYLKAHAARDWAENESKLEKISYVGNYLLTAKDPESRRTKNALYLIMKVQARNTFSNDYGSYDKSREFFWYICYENILVDPSGNVTVDLSDYSTTRDSFTVDSGVSNGWWGTRAWNYYGYENLDGVEKKIVDQNLDNYTYEKNIDENVTEQTIPEETPEEEEEISNESGYILPNSDTELITKEDLEGLTAEECKLARNEIYARHGRKFNDEALQEYFNSKEWYAGTIEPDDFEESMLNEIEVQNKNVIVEFEEEKGYR